MQGAVVLKAIISKTGVIESLVVVSGPEPLQASAVDAVKHWVYKPYLLNGEPQEVQTTITVNYTLEGLAPGPAASSGAGIDGGPVRVSSGVMASNLVYKPNPFIPASLDTSHVHGAVIVNALVSKTGTVESLQVVSGPKEILPAVLDALRQWRYKPYLLNGEPVQVQTTITMNLEFGGGVSGGEAGVAPKKIGNGVSAPILYSQVDPAYDDQTRAEKVEGAVVVNLWVDTLGHPTHVRVLRGIGHGLDEKAVEAVKQYRFKPAMENGLPVMVELNVEVNFKII